MKRLLYLLMGLLGVLLVGGAVYVLAALAGWVEVSRTQFLGLLSGLTIANSALLGAAWRAREQLSARAQVAFVIWGGVAIWYWTVAPLYYLLNMNLNDLQLAWTAFAFLWEVPVIGGGLLTTLGVVMFRPVERAANAGESQPDPLLAYRRAVRYPGRVALLLFGLSCLGYLVGAWQLWQFAGMSPFELVKSVLNGPIIAIFLAIFYYVTLDRFMDEYRRRLSRWVLDRPAQVRSLRSRLAIVSVAAVIGSIGLLGLLIMQSWQRLQEERLAANMQQDIPILQAADLEDRSGLDTLARGPEGRIDLVAVDNLESLELSAETRAAVAGSSEGVLRDLHGQGKMIAFVERAGGQRLVSTIYLGDYYGFSRPGGGVRFGLGAVMVTGLTAAVFLYVSYEIMRSLVSLRGFAREPSVSSWGKLPDVHTGDEIESIGRAFLRFVQKVEEEDETKREFVSIASHQLRTPLTSILWYVELLLQERDGPLTEQQRHDLERISKGSERMVQLVNDLLNVSRIDSGRLAIRPKKTNLADFVHNLVREIGPQAAEAECEIAIENDLDGVEVRVDQLLLRQVIHNLLINAIKYRRDKVACEITVRLGRETNGELVLTIQDNGMGIPEDEQHRVFEKFWRADNVTMINTEGTGLGLYVSKMLLEASGGRISFTSQEGKGTTFQVRLPAEGMQARPGEVGLAGVNEVE